MRCSSVAGQLMRSGAEATRYTNPLKRKYKARKLAMERAYMRVVLRCSPVLTSPSGRIGCCPRVEAAKRPDAGRIPAAKQNSFPAEPPRQRHERSTHGSVLTVRTDSITRWLISSDAVIARAQISEPARSASHPHEEGHRVRRVHRRGQRHNGERRAAQLQARWREQNQGVSPRPCGCRLI